MEGWVHIMDILMCTILLVVPIGGLILWLLQPKDKRKPW